MEKVKNNLKQVSEEDKLRKVIGLGGALSITSGQIIGAGIMALTGLGIGLTGRSVVFAFMLAALITVIVAMPTAFMGATLPTTGGYYRYTSRILSPKIGFFYLSVFLVGQITIAMYALSFAEYLSGIWPGAPIKLVAAAILTVLYLFNVRGVKGATKLQSILMLLLISSLGIFIFKGLPQVDFSTFTSSNPSFMTGGLKGFFTATALLTFATGGAVVISEMGGEMKNPGKDIPLAIIISTVGIGILYAVMSSVAAGVLPVADTAFKPLTNVAREILSTPLFFYFIIFGAMAALATTLNATFSWVTKGLLIACQDGWLPKSFGEVSEKYGTPHKILTFFYIIGMIPIVTGLSLEFISSLGNAAIQVANILPLLAAWYLPKRYPEAYKNSKFKINKQLLKVIVVIGVILQFVQGYFLMEGMPVTIIISAVLYMAVAYTFASLKFKSGKVIFEKKF